MKNFFVDFDVVFHVEHSKMRKDVSKLRNHDFKMKFVELDVGFSMAVSKMRKDA